MTCADCSHPPADHLDRMFGGWHCAPPMGETGFQTRRCECSGWRMEAGTGDVA